MGQLDPSTIIGAILLALSNLGAAKLLLTRSLERQDKMDEKIQKHGELLSTASQTQATTVAALAKVQESVKELYESRNAHSEELVAIDTLHDFKGCKVLNQGGKS
jgi:hypothetical protein